MESPKKYGHFRLAADVRATLKRLSEQNKTTQTAEVEAAIRERGERQLQPRTD